MGLGYQPCGLLPRSSHLLPCLHSTLYTPPPAPVTISFVNCFQPFFLQLCGAPKMTIGGDRWSPFPDRRTVASCHEAISALTQRTRGLSHPFHESLPAGLSSVRGLDLPPFPPLLFPCSQGCLQQVQNVCTPPISPSR